MSAPIANDWLDPDQVSAGAPDASSSAPPLTVGLNAPPAALQATDWTDPDQMTPPPPVSTLTDVAKAAPSGLAVGTAEAAGAPGGILDAIGNASEYGLQRLAVWSGLAPKGVQPQSYADIAASNKALTKGTDILPRTDDVLQVAHDQAGFTPYQPQTLPGQFVGKTAEFLPSTLIGPGGLVAKGVTAAGSAAGDMVATGATKGTYLEPYAGVAGAIVGGGVGAGLASAGKAIAPALSQGAAESKAADIVMNSAHDPAALRSTIANDTGTGELVPGSMPTSFQKYGDVGLGDIERAVNTRNPQAFVENSYGTGTQQQNAARVASLNDLQGAGDPLAVADMFRQQKQNIEDFHDFASGQAAQDAQSQAEALGGVNTPNQTGQAIKSIIDPEFNAAQSDAQTATSSLGGTDRTDAYGNTLRASAQSAANTSKDNLSALFSTVQDNVTVPLKPVQQFGIDLYKNMGPAAQATVTPAESAIAKVLTQYGPQVPFKEARDVDTLITSSMRQELKTNGSTPSYRRMVQMKGAWEDAMHGAVGVQADGENAAVAAGTMDPSQTIGAKIQALPKQWERDPTAVVNPGEPPAYTAPLYDPTAMTSAPKPPDVPRPQNLHAFVKSAGGMQDPGGDLASMGLNNLIAKPGQGLGPDAMRQAAAQSGYLGADVDHAMANTDVNDLLNAVGHDQPVHSVKDDVALGAWNDYDQARADYARGRSEAEGRSTLGVKQPNAPGVPFSGPDDISSKLTGFSNDYAENSVGNSRVGSVFDPSLGDSSKTGVYGTTRTARGPSRLDASPEGLQGKTPSGPPIDQASLDALAAAKKATIENVNTFKKGVVGNLLKSDGSSGSYRMADSAVPDVVFPKGNNGYQAVKQYTKAVGDNATAADALHNYAAATLRKTALNDDGTLNTAKYAQWRNNYGEAFKALPKDVQSNFDTAGNASNALQRFGNFTPDIAPAAVPELFFAPGKAGADGVKQLRSLVGDDRADAILSDHAAGLLKAKAENPDGSINPQGLKQFMTAHKSAMDQFPQLKDRFTSAAKATQTVGDIAAGRAQALKNYQATVAGKFLGLTDPTEVRDAVGRMIEQNNVTGLGRLVKATAANPDAAEGVKRSATDYLMRQMLSPSAEAGASGVKELNKGTFQNLMNDNRAALSQILNPGEMNRLTALSQDILRSQRTVNALKMKGTSNTAPDAMRAVKFDNGHHESLMRQMVEGTIGGGEVGGEHGAFLGAGLAVGNAVKNALRDAGMRKTYDVLERAVLDPDFMKTLIMKAPAKAGTGSHVTLTNKLAQYSMYRGLQAETASQNGQKTKQAYGQ